MNTQKIVNIAVCIIIAGMFGFLAYAGYLIFEPYKPPTLGKGDIPILNENKTIKVGETITTKLDYCVYKGVPCTTTKRYEQLDGDKRVYFFATTVSDGKDKNGKILKNVCGTLTSNSTTNYTTSNVEGDKTTPNTSVVPKDIPPGKYKIGIESICHVNPLKTVILNYQTEEFWVVE